MTYLICPPESTDKFIISLLNVLLTTYVGHSMHLFVKNVYRTQHVYQIFKNFQLSVSVFSLKKHVLVGLYLCSAQMGGVSKWTTRRSSHAVDHMYSPAQGIPVTRMPCCFVFEFIC